MRPSHSPSSQSPASATRADWRTVSTLLPYLLEFKGRVILVVVLLVLAKLTRDAVPLALKEIVDAMGQPKAMLAVPVFLVIGYGLLRLFSTLFG
ncbi:MAG: metal ABC transporter permease, partial [Gallionellaceae bacterium]